MRNRGEIDLDDVHEDDILDRDKAIVELYDTVQNFVKVIAMTHSPKNYDEALAHPVLDKYREFVEKTGIHETG